MTKLSPRYFILALGLGILLLFNQFAPSIFQVFEHQADSELLLIFFSISLLCVLSFGVFHLSRGTSFPSFVVAIFFGMAGHELLSPVIAEREVLSAVVGFGATLILFSGGLETPFANFKKLFWKIISLSFIGLFITAFLFSVAVFFIGQWLGTTVAIAVAVLLGAVLASTDPAAIIPVLKKLRFSNRATKDVIISESALTDVTGTLLTVAFLGILVAGGVFSSIRGGYAELFTAETGFILLEQLIFGVLFGICGYGLLFLLTRFKERHEEEYEADAAFFLFVPIVIFTIAVSLGGSGYLAAFIAGLLFVMTKHLHDTERFFNHTIEGFLKPTIFILLGALVDIQSLLAYAPVGIVTALVFMFVIRPVAVFVSLVPTLWWGRERFSVRELLFISFVRETGAIPAVLLVTIVSMGLPGMDGLVPIGMWVILATLIIEPPLTPLIARFLGVAEVMQDERRLELHHGTKPYVVLGSRGRSFIPRLPRVVEWAAKHNVRRVVLLHCLEDKYTPDLATAIGQQAEAEFAKINESRRRSGEDEIDFTYASRTGFLQQNIDELAKEGEGPAAIFVGKKILDYRLQDIKNLSLPFCFLD